MTIQNGHSTRFHTGRGQIPKIPFALGGADLGHWVPPFLDAGDLAHAHARKIVDHLLPVRIEAFITMMSTCLRAPSGEGTAA